MPAFLSALAVLYIISLNFFQLSSFQPASFFLNPIADFMGCFSVFLR
jgi:hypothetical protein